MLKKKKIVAFLKTREERWTQPVVSIKHTSSADGTLACWENVGRKWTSTERSFVCLRQSGLVFKASLKRQTDHRGNSGVIVGLLMLMGSLPGGGARERRPSVSCQRCCVAARLCVLTAPGWRVESATWKLSFSSGHFNLTCSLEASILSLAVNNPNQVDGGASWWLLWRLVWQRPQGSAASPPQASSASCLLPLPPQWGSAGKDEFAELSLLFLQYSDNSLSLDLLWTFKQPSFFFIITFPKCVTWGHCGISSDLPSWFQGPSCLHQHIKTGLPTSRSLLIASPCLDEGLTRSSASAVATHCRPACWSPFQPWRTFSPQQLLTAKSLVGIFKLRILRQWLMQDNYFCHSIFSPVWIPSNWKVM